MESNIMVALALKLQNLFPTGEDKFLAFPMGLGLTYEELDFLMDDPDDTAETMKLKDYHKSNFAKLLNMIPADELIYAPDTSRFLWDEYRNVLEKAQLAESILSDGEKKSLKKAEDFLFETIDLDGIQALSNSQTVNKYYEYKELSEEAERIYLDEKITVESSNDPELKEDWATYREKELSEYKEKALNDWIFLGRKNEVEKFQEIYRGLTQKAPELYRKTYLDDLKACHEIPGDGSDPIGFYTTFYSPSNSFDTRQEWPRITLQKEEINALIRSAPPELKPFISSEAVNIESLSLDYAKVVCIRNWLKREFFESRYWKLLDDTTIISDGNIPRKGKIPAFITNMIVTRNIEIRRKKTRSTSPSSVKLSFLAKNIKPLRHQMVAIKGTQQSPVKSNIKPLIATAVARPIAQPLKARTVRTATFRTTSKAKPRLHVAAKYAGTSVKMRVPANQKVLRARAISGNVRVRDHRSSAKVRVPARRTSTKVRVPARRPPTKVEKKKPVVEYIDESIELNGIAVVAFVCRRIAKSPNPDSNLTWLS